jgi:hypothetical protein
LIVYNITSIAVFVEYASYNSIRRYAAPCYVCRKASQGSEACKSRQFSSALIYGARARRKVGGPNEADLIQAFKNPRAHTAAGEPDPDDSEAYDTDGDHRSRPKAKRNAYSREKKPATITYLELTDMPNPKEGPDAPWIPITWSLASAKLEVDRKCLREWKGQKQRILRMKKGAKRGREPEMEVQLHKESVAARGEGQIISGRWFLVHAKAIYRRLYPRRISQDEVTGRFTYTLFSFSTTWFSGFRKRYRIKMRCKTKQAQNPREDFREKIEAWLQFNRRNTIINLGSDCGKPRSIEVPLVGRFKLSEIANMDQTPIAFGFLSGRTYDFKGAKTIWVKEQRSGWDRRQAILQICVFADGARRCQPLLIFHGDPVGDSRRREEIKLYDQKVCVAFNKTAWAEKVNLRKWVKKQYSTTSAYFTKEKEPRFLCLDAFAPQMTKELRDKFKRLNYTASYIPGGCTGFVQVLDVSLNQPLKALVAQAAADHADKFYERYAKGDFTVKDRRVLLPRWVAQAWEDLHVKYIDTIIETFQRVGLSLNPDDSKDHKFKIKGLDGIKVGDFNRKDPDPETGLGSLTPADVTIVEAAQGKLREKVAKTKAKRVAKIAKVDAKVQAGRTFPKYADRTAEDFNEYNVPDTITGGKDPIKESSDDEEEYEEALTLGRMGIRSQTQVNRYYTAEEVEEGLDVDVNNEESIEVVAADNSDIDIDDAPSEFDPSDDDDKFNESVDEDSDMIDENM